MTEPVQPSFVLVPLTPEQAAQIGPLFAIVRDAAETGFRGMLVAQVWESRPESGDKPCLHVGFLSHDKAKHLERAIK